jgi:hypothetical protein
MGSPIIDERPVGAGSAEELANWITEATTATVQAYIRLHPRMTFTELTEAIRILTERGALEVERLGAELGVTDSGGPGA